MFLFIIVGILMPIYLLKLYVGYKHEQIRTRYAINGNGKVVAFFHPFCNAGGGGERVMWSAIKALHQRYPQHCYIIYSDNYNVQPLTIVRKASQTFQLDLAVEEMKVHFIQLRLCWLLLAKYYPIFTLLGQNIGSFIVGLEAMLRCPPDIYIDTMGASFTYPLFRLVGSAKVATYTHYPMISADMLQVVACNQSTFNNRSIIAQSQLLTKIKLVYYHLLAFCYRMAGNSANVVMVNSTWTRNHIEALWRRTVVVVYPPCNVDNLSCLSLTNKKANMIISLSQFRPEKNHQLQLKSISRLIDILRENGSTERPLLVMIGSCRNEQDEKLAQSLSQQSIKLGIEDCVQFKLNIHYDEMARLIEEASMAIHTMTNEHFGISVVEFLAAGLLTVAHNSGGPKLDIITENETGFLAEDCDQFAHHLYRIMQLSADNKHMIRLKARKSLEQFSQQMFEQSFCQHMSLLL
ncbi:GDP-Man:Man(3)GlcNAc(2)-PP-Dol alpha-1,2-mannosyltransferase-like protein [Dermatophagoides farinae]|uniref:GDP-Man:Man(3)GlcNAc(2)-PP-Dol alpha-1,2-mannosyltransferase n=1 Tax=Dermatophagoides farinae TaxID=6954 RepID=A0A9D4P6W0_DERFA|nr:GDP-Man:Man(3)GlcNAc(2)-PP-Dol alpha-1,2-mannosyltransferase-like [Dermatophagoides farinae]KAH7645900.1 GDP-Man:Man(3)GlcNAc(2)-PP-Dol alpha-1,2-mannosyltransferase-like protein [Dermatophagoides farinae]